MKRSERNEIKWNEMKWNEMKWNEMWYTMQNDKWGNKVEIRYKCWMLVTAYLDDMDWIANESSWIDVSNQLSLGSTDWGDVVCVWGWAGFVSEAISAETAFPSPSSGQPISFVPNNIHLLHLPHRRPFPLSKSGWNFWLGKRWLLSHINRLRFI